MDIALNKIDETQGSIVVTLKEADYKDRVDSKLKDHSRKASMKGFRPGKVPIGMIKKMYGKSVLIDEINNLLGESVDKYINDEKLKLVGRPLPNFENADQINWDEQKEFEFSYDVGLIPDFKVDVTSKIKVDKYVIKTDKAAVDDTINNITSQNAASQPVDESNEGDFISGKLVGEGLDKDVMVPTNQIVKEKKKFNGLKAGDTLEFDLQKVFDKDASKIGYLTGLQPEETAELKGKYTLTVESITRSIPAELNQELFDKTFGPDTVKSEEEFRTKIEETIVQNYDRESVNLVNRDLIENLVKKFDFELSKEFIEKFIRANNDKLSDKEIEESLDNYIHDLKWSLIRNEINKDEKIDIPQEIVVESARQRLMAQFNLQTVTPDLEERFGPIVDNYLRENNGQNYMNEYENLLTGKILDSVREKVTIKEKKVSVDDFNKEVDKRK